MDNPLIIYGLPFASVLLLTVGIWPHIFDWRASRGATYQEWLDEQLYTDCTGEQLAGYCMISGVCFLIFGYIIFSGFIVPVFVMMLGYWFPYLIVSYQIKKRHQLLEEQLGQGLTSLANSMRAGLTFVQALREASNSLEKPIADEFGYIAAEYELGKSLDEALKHSKHRFRSVNYNLAVLAILVSRQQGGNLSETLERISAFMRDVFAIDRKIRVLTAEGRFSAKIIGLSPFFMGTMLYLGAPETMTPLFTDPVGGAILFIAVMMNLVAFAWIQKIIQINV